MVLDLKDMLICNDAYVVRGFHNINGIIFRCKKVIFKLNNVEIGKCKFENSQIEFNCTMSYGKTQKINYCYFDKKSTIKQKDGASLEIRNSIIKSAILKNKNIINFHNCTIENESFIYEKPDEFVRFFDCKIEGNVFSELSVFINCTFHFDKIPTMCHLNSIYVDIPSRYSLIRCMVIKIIPLDIWPIVASYLFI